MASSMRIFLSLSFLVPGLLFFHPAGAKTNPGAYPADAMRNSTSQLARAEKENKPKTDREVFREMCEFLELDEQQTKQALELFDIRINEIKQIFSSAASGKSSQKEAIEKNAESFKKHRELFLLLLKRRALPK